MSKAYINPLVIQNCSNENLLIKLQSTNKILDEIQVSLQYYLENKCKAFPRFFFLSNDELLGILSKSRNPVQIQPDIRKIFEGINKLNFEQETILSINGMYSTEPD